MRSPKTFLDVIRLFREMFWRIFEIVSKGKNISVRNFSGSSVPVGSKIGKVLVNSVDSKKVVRAIRVAVSKGKTQTVKLSASTKHSIQEAKSSR